MLYNKDSYFTNVQTKIEAKIWIFLSHGVFLSKLPVFLIFSIEFYF